MPDSDVEMASLTDSTRELEQLILTLAHKAPRSKRSARRREIRLPVEVLLVVGDFLIGE